MQARMTAIKTQKVWLPSIADSQLCCFCSIVWSRVIAIVDLRLLPWPAAGQTCSMAPVMSPVTSSGELAAIVLSATLRPRRMHDDAVGDREHVGHAVADQHDGDALVAQLADEVQHLGHLAHRDRRRRLVHQHDLGVGQPGAGDRHRLALAARHLLDEIARARLRLQFREDLAGAPVHGGIVEDAGTARRRGAARGRERRWPPRSDCCRAPDPGGRSRCRAGAPRPAGAARVPCRPCCMVPWLGRKLPAIILTSVDLPAPLSPIRPTTSPASSDSETSLTAWMAPKCFEMLVSSRTATSNRLPVAACGRLAATSKPPRSPLVFPVKTRRLLYAKQPIGRQSIVR